MHQFAFGVYWDPCGALGQIPIHVRHSPALN